MKVNWKEISSRWRGKIPLPAVLVLAVGCLLLMIPAGSGAEAVDRPQSEQNEGFGLEEFEQRLEQAVSRIAGAGECSVVLTLRGGSRKILARDREQDSSGGSERAVIVGKAGEEQVVSVQTVAPEFRGALVVCPGADSPQVRLEVTKAVSVLTGLGSDCICVSTGAS